MVALDRHRPEARTQEALRERLAPVTAIYAPNASGKSNVVGALVWLIDSASSSWRTWTDAIPVEQFAFGDADQASIELELTLHGVRFEYLARFSRRNELGHTWPGLRSWRERAAATRRWFEDAEGHTLFDDDGDIDHEHHDQALALLRLADLCITDVELVDDGDALDAGRRITQPRRVQLVHDVNGGRAPLEFGAAIDYLDDHPTDLSHRLHQLDCGLAARWSLAPPPPADGLLRILLRPESSGRRGHWRLDVVTRRHHR